MSQVVTEYGDSSGNARRDAVVKSVKNLIQASNHKRGQQTATDWGLLVLRGASLFLAATFGLQKLTGLLILLRSGEPWAAWGLMQFVRQLGFPFPVVLTICATLSESVIAFMVACGFMTRIAAASVALNMAVALYISLRIKEEPLRATLYLIIFIALVITGPGRFSVDHALKRWRARP
jgi:putative oxidoreductase